jgi:hypothetical protein
MLTLDDYKEMQEEKAAAEQDDEGDEYEDDEDESVEYDYVAVDEE